ncbi:hypothetical protein [Tenacibaculum aiptasiae]|uniref:hypothetical protein n=1 Tax=Tenacibaculum aiptasiae TaxID=426481 RepID=UPI00232BA8E5|nr:hypothetical protein [Tenacibaculum aiptasiae]
MAKSKKTKKNVGLIEALLIVALAGIAIHIQTKQEKEEILKIEQRVQKKEINVSEIIYNSLSLIALITILIVIIIKL